MFYLVEFDDKKNSLSVVLQEISPGYNNGIGHLLAIVIVILPQKRVSRECLNKNVWVWLRKSSRTSPDMNQSRTKFVCLFIFLFICLFIWMLDAFKESRISPDMIFNKYLLTVLKLFDIVLQEISPGYNNGISHFICRCYSQVAIKKSLQGMLKQKCPGVVAQIVQDKSRHDFQSSLSQMVIGT